MRTSTYDPAVPDVYPPPHHFLRDLRPISTWVSEDELHVIAAVGPEMLDGAAAISPGVIAAVADIAGAQVVMADVEGDWIGTVDLSLHTSAPIVQGPIVIVARLLRAGKRLAVVRAEVFDGEGAEAPTRLAGAITLTFSRMARGAAAGVSEPFRTPDVGNRHEMAGEGSGFTTSVPQAVGVQVHAPGEVAIEKTPYVQNSFGTLNGGVTALLVEAAGVSAGGVGWHAADLLVRYLGQVRQGPAVATATLLREADDHAVADVVVREGDYVIATGTVTLNR